jgi:hypothetical protein
MTGLTLMPPSNTPLNLYCIQKAARSLAESCHQVKKHVSIVVQDNQIVTSATNGFEVPSRYAFMGYRSLHSEAAAMLKFRGNKNGLSLYNFRFNNKGALRLSKPCSICLPWCESVFDSIYYTTNDGEILRLMRNDN